MKQQVRHQKEEAPSNEATSEAPTKEEAPSNEATREAPTKEEAPSNEATSEAPTKEEAPSNYILLTYLVFNVQFLFSQALAYCFIFISNITLTKKYLNVK